MKKLTVAHSVSEFFTSPFNTVYQPINKTNTETNTGSKKLEKYVTYDEDGNFVEVEMKMEVSALSSSISEFVKKNYNKNIIKEASEIIEANGTVFYKAELTREDLFFDSTFNFIKSIKH